MLLAHIPVLFVGSSMLLVAAWILARRPTAAVHRAFALMVGVRAAISLLSVLDGDLFSPIGRVTTYLVIATPFAALNFVYVFWQARSTASWASGARRRRIARSILLISLVLTELAYLQDHSLVYNENGVSGPLSLFYPAIYASFAAAALAFAWMTSSAPVGDRARVRPLAIGFLLEPAFQSGLRLLTWLNPNGSPAGWELIDLSLRLFTFLCIPLTLVLLAPLRRGLVRRPSRSDVRVTLMIATAVATGLVAYALFQASQLELAISYLLAMEAFWRFALVVGTAYAVLQFQMFDSKKRLQFAVKQSTLVGGIGLLFVVASETLELIIDAQDQVIAIGVAVALGLGFRVLQTLAGMIASRLAPAEAFPESGPLSNAQEQYDTAFQELMADGRLTDREKRILDRLARRLAIKDTGQTAADLG